MSAHKLLILFLTVTLIYNAHASGDANVTISTGTTTNGSWSGSGTMTFTPSADNAVVKISEITGYLTSGKNVVILTSCSGSGSQSGDVTISGTITAAMTTSNKTFTITAAGTITVNSAINLSGASGGTTGYSGGKINFTSSGGAVAINNTITTSGNAASAVAYGAGGAGGSVTISGTSVSMTGGSGITTTGGTGRGNGGAGGAVTITSTSTSINFTKNITTSGGCTGTAVNGASAGNGGAVNITANTSLTVANITARGGCNSHYYSCQGSGANVDLTGSSITKGTINTTKGSSAGGGASCGSKTDGTLSETISCTDRTVGAASSSPTVCKNTAITDITHATTEVTGIASSTDLPNGVTASYASNTITISGTPTESGTFNYTITPTSDCGSATATGTITVNSLPEINLLSPFDHFGEPDLTPTFDWSSSGTGTLDNHFYIDTDPNIFSGGTSTDVNTATTNTPGSNLTAGTIYYWGVQVTDDNCTNQSVVQQFWPLNPSQGGTVNDATTISSNSDGAQSVMAADLDGDGDMDLISAASVDNQIMYYENDGSESFTEYEISSSTSGARFAYPADIDGDGDIDIVTASADANKIAWFENDGTPDAGWSENSISTSATAARQAFPVDLDGDGDMDIIAASKALDEIMWYENDGSESFSETQITSNADGIESLYPVDLDGDGDIDIVSAGYLDDQIMWYENNGSESFTEREISANADGAIYVSVGDLDNDGDIDVLSASDVDDQVMWYENDGSPSDGGWTEYELAGSLTNPSSVVTGDLNGDTYLDVIYTQRGNDKIIWLANDGTPSDGGWTSTTITTTADGVRKANITDLDSDGDLDIISSDLVGDKIKWYENVVPLPVELLNFSAFKEEKLVFITWETAAEINNDYFIVEKSSDGINWESIKTVPGAGNSFAPITYNIIDPYGCDGNCYYRLKQIDFDGTQTTYKAILLNGKNQNNKLEVNVYPNPTSDLIDISLLIQESESYTITLTNTLGEIVYKHDRNLVKGLNYMNISLTNYRKGSYYLQVYSDSQLLTTVPIIKL